MNTNARRHDARWLAIATLVMSLLVAACGAGTGDIGPVATPPPTPGGSLPIPSAEPTPGSSGTAATAAPGSPLASPAAMTTVRAYFFLGSFKGDAGLVPVLRVIPATKAVGSAAIQAVLDGPNGTELGARPAMYTDVPEGTRLLGLTIDNGVATVNLSKEFQGGSDVTTIYGRIAQVVYTLTQFPTVTAVRFESDGSPVGAPSKPIVTRADFASQLPAIWVDGPAWGGVLANPGRVTGFADVFEAAFRIQVLDGAGHSLADVPAMASCGTGCLGTFAVTVPYSLASAQWGTLRVYDRSAKDGSKEHVVDYPVWLTPSS